MYFGSYNNSQLTQYIVPEKLKINTNSVIPYIMCENRNIYLFLHTDLESTSFDLNMNLPVRESMELFKQDLTIVQTAISEIEPILSKTPREFEKLVVSLMQKLGYGGQIKNSGLVTQATNDKGIDGIIKEDILGFGRIYNQAKRYNRDNLIGREDIQKFVGALAVENSDKGVFITTSDFNKGAYEYVENLSSNNKIVLINGNKLSEYIYEFNLGMQTEKLIEVKRLDSDFWDNLENEK